MRFTETCGSRSGKRPGWVVSYPLASYASRRPALELRAFAASRPNSGSSRIALACGVSTLVTEVLNSLIISGVISFLSTPRADARDFCKLPRWSMAAAAMMPAWFESAFMGFHLPPDNFIQTLLQVGDKNDNVMIAGHTWNDFIMPWNRPARPTGWSISSNAGNTPGRGPHRAGSATSRFGHRGTCARPARARETPRGCVWAPSPRAVRAERFQSRDRR